MVSSSQLNAAAKRACGSFAAAALLALTVFSLIDVAQAAAPGAHIPGSTVAPPKDAHVVHVVDDHGRRVTGDGATVPAAEEDGEPWDEDEVALPTRKKLTKLDTAIFERCEGMILGPQLTSFAMVFLKICTSLNSRSELEN